MTVTTVPGAASGAVSARPHLAMRATLAIICRAAKPLITNPIMESNDPNDGA